jgi:ubiquinone/menaquinone biosynthesis C-methylase UbiE
LLPESCLPKAGLAVTMPDQKWYKTKQRPAKHQAFQIKRPKAQFMSQSSELHDFYENYYDDAVGHKREITAQQTVDHIVSLNGDIPLGSVLDIGAGDGAVLSELERRGLGKEFHAVEISDSGIERIKRRNLKRLKSIQSFDGYTLPFPDNSFDTALLIHVLEHVEHERLLLREIRRVSRRCYIEVPLEHTMRLRRSISMSKPFGHINYYTAGTFENVLDTAGLRPVVLATFAHSKKYEQLLSGQTVGSIKRMVRSTALKIAPALARQMFVYLGAAICEHKEADLLK